MNHRDTESKGKSNPMGAQCPGLQPEWGKSNPVEAQCPDPHPECRWNYSSEVKPCWMANLTRVGRSWMPSFCMMRLR
jgi:hypothetical protein